MQPAAAAGSQITLDVGDCFGAAKVHVGGFPAHVVEQARFVSLFGERGEFDAAAIRGQPAHEPLAVEMYAGVLDADGIFDQLRAVDRIGGNLHVPGVGGSADAFGFARDEGTLPRRKRKNSRMAQAAEAGDAPF